MLPPCVREKLTVHDGETSWKFPTCTVSLKDNATTAISINPSRFGLAKRPDSVIIDGMTEDLYELVGGRATLNAAIDVFYKRVLEDDELRPFFKRVDMAHLRSRQVMFVSMLLGGRVYTGKGLQDAHALSRDHGLNSSHFDLFLEHFRAALEEVGVKADVSGKVATLLERKRATILDDK
jgi:hemoglobin